MTSTLSCTACQSCSIFPVAATLRLLTARRRKKKSRCELMCAEAGMAARPSRQTQDVLSELITKRCFHLLLLEEQEAFRDTRVIRQFETISCADDHQRAIVEVASDRIKELISLSPQPVPWKTSDFTARSWEINASNVHSEFSRVADVLFQDEVNWGRIVALLGFAVSYSVYAMQKGLQDTVVESVCAWTVQVMQSRLHHWLQEHTWVSTVRFNI